VDDTIDMMIAFKNGTLFNNNFIDKKRPQIQSLPRCSKCKKQFKTKNELDNHLKAIHPIKIIKQSIKKLKPESYYKPMINRSVEIRQQDDSIKVGTELVDDITQDNKPQYEIQKPIKKPLIFKSKLQQGPCFESVNRRASKGTRIHYYINYDNPKLNHCDLKRFTVRDGDIMVISSSCSSDDFQKLCNIHIFNNPLSLILNNVTSGYYDKIINYFGQAIQETTSTLYIDDISKTKVTNMKIGRNATWTATTDNSSMTLCQMLQTWDVENDLFLKDAFDPTWSMPGSFIEFEDEKGVFEYRQNPYEVNFGLCHQMLSLVFSKAFLIEHYPKAQEVGEYYLNLINLLDDEYVDWYVIYTRPFKNMIHIIKINNRQDEMGDIKHPYYKKNIVIFCQMLMNLEGDYLIGESTEKARI